MKKWIFISVLLILNSCKNTLEIKELKNDQRSEQDKMPNIVYILADDLGYGDVSTFNEKSKIKTPHIDRMASEGIKFTDAHTSSSVCSPTRYGILTGRYSWRSRLKEGVLTGKSLALIPKSRSTVASILKKQGYATAFIGKWHLGWDWTKKDASITIGDGWDAGDFDNIDFTKPITNTPNDVGFDYSYGISASLDMPPYVYVENGKATEIPDTVTVNDEKYTFWRKGPTSKDFIHEEVTPNVFKRSIKYIKQNAKGNKPFFLYMALPSPHTPILPTKEWQGKSNLSPYGDFVMMIDSYIGQLIHTIQEEGIEKNTLIIFTSDNGCAPLAGVDEMMEKGHYPSYIYRGFKADIFEGGHRVPFIAKWPQKIKKGMTSNEIICSTDLMATCAEIVGYSLSDNEGEDSYSLVPLFEGRSLDSSFREAMVHHSINGSFSIRKGDWKLILCPGSGGWSWPRPNDKKAIDTLPKVQLYNLKDGPNESKNLQEIYSQKKIELKNLLKKYIINGRSTPGIPQKNDSIDFQWEQIEFATEQKRF